MDKLRERIIKNMVASCSCMTKTPIPEYHDQDCLYKVLGDCLQLLDNKKFMVYQILGTELSEKLVKDQYNCINDLDDGWQENEYSCRVGKESAKFAVEILHSLCKSLEPDFLNLHDSIMEAINNLSEEDANDINKLVQASDLVKNNWKLQH